MMKYTLFFVYLIQVEQCKSDCNAYYGPSGSPECVQLRRYNGEQWATCLTDVYIRTFSKGKHQCEDRTATYCWYQCMMELYTIRSGYVTGQCQCNATTSTDAPETSTVIPDWCYSPSGDDCSWYRNCLEKRYPCKQYGESYAIDYAEKFCKLYDEHAFSFDKQGREWINAVRKCLQVNLVPILRPFVTITCEEIKQRAFNSHPDCYVSPDDHAPSICDIGLKNWMRVFMTVKSAFTDAPLDTMLQMLQVGTKCGFKWIRAGIEFVVIKFIGFVEWLVDDLRLIYDSVVEFLAQNRRWPNKGIQYFGYPILGDSSSFQVIILLMPAEEYDLNYKGNIAANVTSAALDTANAVKNGEVRFTLPGNVQATNFSICEDNTCESTRMTVQVPPPATSAAEPYVRFSMFTAMLLCSSILLVKNIV